MLTLLNENCQTKLVDRVAKDPQFVAQLMSDPKETLSSFLSVDLPSDLQVSVHQESRNSLHIVLPAFDASQESDIDIADDEILAGCSWGSECQSSISPE